MRLTTIQRNILGHLERWPEVLRFGAHYTPKWWMEGGQRVSAQSCDALLLRGLISNTRHLGGEPGINCFSIITDAGRAALQQGSAKQVKLTKAQLRLLQRFAAAPPGTSLHLSSVDRGYNQMPIFRGRMHMPNCPTCGHPSEVIAVSFDCIVALHEKGAIKERLRGTEIFYNDDITPAGRAALESQQ